MECKGQGCTNEVDEGHCELCYLEWEAKKCGEILVIKIKPSDTGSSGK